MSVNPTFFLYQMILPVKISIKYSLFSSLKDSFLKNLSTMTGFSNVKKLKSKD